MDKLGSQRKYKKDAEVWHLSRLINGRHVALDEQQTPLTCWFSKEKVAASTLDFFQNRLLWLESSFLQSKKKEDMVYKHNITQIKQI